MQPRRDSQAMVTGLLVLAALIAVIALTRGGRADIADPRVQLKAAEGARYAPRPIMNRTEFKRFVWLEDWARGTPYRVFAQVPYGEVLGTPDRDAFRAINSKRADILVVDGRGMPVAAIEVQGAGHYQGDARARDAVKRAALASAGVPLIEVFEETTRAELIDAVEAAAGV